MMEETARNKVRSALREAILSLCNNALDYTMELSIEGLLGVTIDKQDVFLVNVNEVVRSPEYEDLLAEPSSPPPPEQKAPRGMSKRSYMKQLVKRRSAMRKAATIAKVKTWKMTEKLKETEKAELLQELLPEMQTKKSELVTLTMMKSGPPKKRIREASFSDENTAGLTSPIEQNGEGSEGSKGEEESPNRDWIPPEDKYQHQNSSDLHLPDPLTSPDKAEMIRIMNEVVGYNFMKKKELRRKRGEYNNYSSEVRLRIGQYAAEHGIPATLRHFKKEFGRPISDSTVRSLRRAYISAMDKNKDDLDNIKELPKKDRGRPLKLKEYDQEVLDYIDNIRKNGGTINVQIVMDAARGVLLHKAKHKLKEFGGKIEITKGWADSFIRRMKHAGYLPDSKTSRKDEEVPEETSKPETSSVDQSNHTNVSEKQLRTNVVTPALSELSYNSASEPLPHDTFEHVNLTGFQHGQNQHLHQHQTSSPSMQHQASSPSMHHHHHHHTVSGGVHQRHLHNMPTSGLPSHPPSHTSVAHTPSQPLTVHHTPHLDHPQSSPRMDDQDFINHAQPQISPRFSQPQLSPRDYSQQATSYLNSTFAHLRPPLDQVQGSEFLGHRSVGHLSDAAAGYMGALLHSRGELRQGRDDLEHQSETSGSSSNYSNMPPGARMDQHAYMSHVLPPSGRNHSQQM